MDKTIERISKHEEELDYLLESIPKLKESLNEYKECFKIMKKLNRYYGSNIWFSDVEKYDKGMIPKIKAGVLSEDAIYNVYMDLLDLEKDFKEAIK